MTTMVFLGLIPVRPDTIVVGDPTHPNTLPMALLDAYNRGARDITLAPGTYAIPASGNSDVFALPAWRDLTIHARGVTVIFLPGQCPIHFQQCVNVTWDGGTFRFSRPAFTQGRVVAAGSDGIGPYYDWQIDAGYPTNLDTDHSWFNVVDLKTHGLKVNTGDWSSRDAVPASPGLLRLHYWPKAGGNIAVGDVLVRRSPAGWTIFHLNECEACTLRNVVLENGGFGTIFETGGAGANRYLGCTIEPGPRPEGATEEPLVGCGADGFHSAGTRTGPDLEDCVFRGVFLDDCIAIHGGFGRVLDVSGTNLTITGLNPLAGKPLRIADTHGFFAQATCTAVENLPNGKRKVTLDQDLHVPIDHSQDGDPRLGTKGSTPDFCGAGYKILRCRLGHTRSRGILVKADHGLIQDCTIEGTGMSGISIGPEFWWNEAGYCWGVTVAHNVFRECNLNNGDQASVLIHGDGAIGNRDITLIGNRFEDCYGTSMIHADDVDALRITHNHFDGSFPLQSSSRGNIVRLGQVQKVELLGNVVAGQGPFAGDLVGQDGSSDGTILHNDATGIRLAPDTAK